MLQTQRESNDIPSVQNRHGRQDTQNTGVGVTRTGNKERERKRKKETYVSIVLITIGKRAAVSRVGAAAGKHTPPERDNIYSIGHSRQSKGKLHAEAEDGILDRMDVRCADRALGSNVMHLVPVLPGVRCMHEAMSAITRVSTINI